MEICFPEIRSGSSARGRSLARWVVEFIEDFSFVSLGGRGSANFQIYRSTWFLILSFLPPSPPLLLSPGLFFFLSIKIDECESCLANEARFASSEFLQPSEFAFESLLHSFATFPLPRKWECLTKGTVNEKPRSVVETARSVTRQDLWE